MIGDFILKTYDENICTQIEKKSGKSSYPISPEIVQTSSFYFPNYEDFIQISDDEKNNFVYTRGTNPTTHLLEKQLAELEHGEKCKVFSSGMGAITATLFTLLKQGDHLLCVNTVYGETMKFAQYMEKFGVECSHIHLDEGESIESYLKDQTRVIYFESPSSQVYELLDLEVITSIAKARNIYTVIDNTWASPLLQHALDYGVDVVIHSCSKYIGGHSDLVAGAVIGSEALVDEIFEYGHQILGAVNSPFNSWLAIRGLRTLPVRMKQFDESIKSVLDGIKEDPRIGKLFHPYLSTGKQKQLAEKYLSGYGSLFSLQLADPDTDKMIQFVNALEVITVGVSWGGFESLALPVFKGSNAEAVQNRGLSLVHVRIFVGLENPESIIADIKQALDLTYGKVS